MVACIDEGLNNTLVWPSKTLVFAQAYALANAGAKVERRWGNTRKWVCSGCGMGVTSMFCPGRIGMSAWVFCLWKGIPVKNLEMSRLLPGQKRKGVG